MTESGESSILPIAPKDIDLLIECTASIESSHRFTIRPAISRGPAGRNVPVRITSARVSPCFTEPRPDQRGLFPIHADPHAPSSHRPFRFAKRSTERWPWRKNKSSRRGKKSMYRRCRLKTQMQGDLLRRRAGQAALTLQRHPSSQG